VAAVSEGGNGYRLVPVNPKEDDMLMISMPKKTFKTGSTELCRINGEEARLTWRDEKTLVIEPGDARAILTIHEVGDLLQFSCARQGLAGADYEWDGHILSERAQKGE
jgi:hypothetical protein